MSIVKTILLVAMFLLLPALVLRLCRRYAWLDKLGPIVTLYFVGAAIGNLGLLGIPLFPEEMPKVQNMLNNIMVPLAIPLMLFGCVFRKSDTRDQLLSMISGLVAVVIALVVGYLVFGKMIVSDTDPKFAARVGGMLTGSYTGGTVNMASIQKMLGVPEETFVLANTFDMIVCFTYLMFLVSVGIKIFRKFLPVKTLQTASAEDEAVLAQEVAKAKENPYKGLFTAAGLKSAAASFGLTIAVFAVSFGVATLIDKAVEADIFMMVFILMLTTLGIGASFIKPVRNLKYSYDIGMYLIYIFSLVVASMADLSKIDFTGSVGILGYITLIVFGSLLLHMLFAKLLKIDADTMVITSVTYINSPPFVPMIAAAMKNRNVLLPGLTIGIVGYAIGNYLGLLIFQLLSIL